MKREKIDYPFDLQINDTQWKEHKISALIRSSKKQSSSPESLKNIRTKTWRKNGPNALRTSSLHYRQVEQKWEKTGPERYWIKDAKREGQQIRAKQSVASTIG